MLKHSKNVQAAGESLKKISSIVFNSSQTKLAVANFDKTVSFFDANDYSKKERMPTRGAEKTNKNYIIRALCFSPDSNVLSIAQSDNIIYSYKVGSDFGAKKSICSKILLKSPASCIQWPTDQLNEFYFGDNSGQVQMAVIKKHRAELLYDTGSYCLNLALDPTNKYMVSGHLDKCIFLYDVVNKRQKLLTTGITVPSALAIGKHIVYAGNDQKVYFLDKQGNSINRFDFSADKTVREFSGAYFNPSGDSVVLTNFSSFFVFSLNQKRNTWEKKMHMKIDNYYVISSAVWKPDGSQFIISNVCGAVDVFSVSVKKLKLNKHFEVNYVSNSKVRVVELQTSQKTTIESHLGAEIEHIEMKKKQFVIARTSKSLLIADTKSKQSSEILWDYSGEEIFNFDNDQLVLIKTNEEVSALHLGKDEILGSIRTDFFHKKLLCGSIFPKEGPNQQKLLCYLLDTQTACVLDLNSKMNVCLVEHDNMISGLELDTTGHKLMFKDSKKEVFVFDTTTKKKVSLARNVGFWGWVPESDVMLCQSTDKLCVWYSSDHLSNWQSLPVKGRVVRIQSDHKETKVITLDGNLEKEVALDGLLIRFNFALKENNFGDCLAILKEDYSQESSFHWRNLLKVALREKNYFVAEKCYAALGDYGKHQFFKKINELQRKAVGKDNWEVKTELALLNKQFVVAENLLLEKDLRDKAMEVYQEMHRWEDAIRIGREMGQGQEMQTEYIDWLLGSGQQLKAAEILVKEGQLARAAEIFCEQGLPGLGASLMIEHKVKTEDSVWDKLEKSMEDKKLFWVLGELQLYRGKRVKALNFFIKGNHFEKAMSLARKKQPEILVGLHEKWGDWLREDQQLETAVNHFVEARNVKKAVEVSLELGDWGGAIRLSEGLSSHEQSSFQQQIGKRLKEKGHYSLAEKQLIKAGKVTECVQMWLEAERFEEAERVCRENKVGKDQMEEMFCRQADSMTDKGHFEKAEKVYLSLGLTDKAIRMYKNQSQWVHMLRLFGEFRPENLNEAHVLIGKKRAKEKEYEEAEEHFLRGGDWRLALAMYEGASRVKDCLRVLGEFGSPEETTGKMSQYEQIEGTKCFETLLRKAHMSDVLIDFLCVKGKFSDAFEIAENARHKLEETHLKYGEYLAAQGNFQKAEEEFGKVNRWEVAVQMFAKEGKFEEALRVAGKVGPESIKAVHLKRGDWFLNHKQFQQMEESYIEAGQADRAVTVYLEEGLLEEAVRIAKKFCRSRVKEVLEKMEIMRQNMSGQEILNHGRLLEDSRSFAKAVDIYMTLGREHFDKEEVLVQVWEKAVQLAFTHDKQRYTSVVLLAARKLETIGRYSLAGFYYENVGKINRAVENFLKAKEFERAQCSAEREPNPRERERLIHEVQESYRTQLESRQDADLLLKNEQLESGVSALIQKGDWERALSVTNGKDEQLFSRLIRQMCTHFLSTKNYHELLRLLDESECQFQEGLLSATREVSTNVLSACNPPTIELLRKVLRRMLNCQKGLRLDNNVRGELDRYFRVAHLLCLKQTYQAKEEKDLMAKVSFSCLRFVDLIPVDKAFYQAGQALKDCGQEKLAFLVLNTYLDIYEAIEEGGSIETSDEDNLSLLDLPCLADLSLANQNFISAAEKNSIRDWLLSVSAKHGTNLCLPKIRCKHCAANISDKCLSCPKCMGLLGDMCVLSGEVILNSSQSQKCQNCSESSIKENLQKFKLVGLNCPWCDALFDD